MRIFRFVLILFLFSMSAYAVGPQIFFKLGGDWLYGNAHTRTQCTTAGGTVISVSNGTICRFTAATCPGGWTQLNNWSTTTAQTCSDAMCAGVGACTTSSHSWNDTEAETCLYGRLVTMCVVPLVTCTANITQVGCY